MTNQTTELSPTERAAAERIIVILRDYPKQTQISLLGQACILMGEYRLAGEVLQHARPIAGGGGTIV